MLCVIIIITYKVVVGHEDDSRASRYRGTVNDSEKPSGKVEIVRIIGTIQIKELPKTTRLIRKIMGWGGGGGINKTCCHLLLRA